MGFERGAVAARADLEPADGPAGEKADDDCDHRGDKPAQRPAEDDDDAMLLARRLAPPH